MPVADLDQAVDALMGAGYGSAGERCMAVSVAMPVGETTADALVAKLKPRVRALKIGPATDAAAEMGPLVTAQHLARVRAFTDGLATVYTGPTPSGPGYWHPIMIATPSDADAAICRDEVFGPVAVVIPFDDEADAIRICNDSVYGLSGSVWTGDGSRALRVVRAMDAGTISVNSNSSVRYSTPFGGFKQSGLGREHSMAVLDHYTELKNVFIATGA